MGNSLEDILLMGYEPGPYSSDNELAAVKPQAEMRSFQVGGKTYWTPALDTGGEMQFAPPTPGYQESGVPEWARENLRLNPEQLKEDWVRRQTERYNWLARPFNEENAPTKEELFNAAMNFAPVGMAKAIKMPKGLKTFEEFKNWEFKVPEGGSSKTPKSVLSWKREDYDTLSDIVNRDDRWLIDEVLGANSKAIFDKIAPSRGLNASTHLIDKVQKGEPITIYRAVEKGSGQDIIPGAYVTESLDYARGHGERILKRQMNTEYEIKKLEVYPDELMSYHDPHEFIYIPRNAKVGYRRYKEQLIKRDND